MIHFLKKKLKTKSKKNRMFPGRFYTYSIDTTLAQNIFIA